MWWVECQLPSVQSAMKDSLETLRCSSALWVILYVKDVIQESRIVQNVEDRWLEDAMILNSSYKLLTCKKLIIFSCKGSLQSQDFETRAME